LVATEGIAKIIAMNNLDHERTMPSLHGSLILEPESTVDAPVDTHVGAHHNGVDTAHRNGKNGVHRNGNDSASSKGMNGASPTIMNSVATVEMDLAPAEIQTQIQDSRLFSKLFDELGEAVLISDESGRIVRANQSAARILRMPVEQLKGLMHHDPIWQAVLEDGSPVPTAELPATKTLRTGQAISHVELGVVRSDGTLVWILESAAPIFDETGRLTGVIVTFPDISLAIKQRQELRDLNQKYQKERDRANAANRLKSTFLANMSHEIRSPMTAILGFSEVLMGELKGQIADHHTAFLHSIIVSGRRLLTLLNDILDLSKIEAGHIDIQKSEIDINDEVETWVTPLILGANQKSLTMQILLHPEALIINADRQRFGQVMTNIVGNAIKFTPSGSIKIRTYTRPGKGITDYAVIEVEDSGIGIAEEFLPNLFEEFRQGAERDYEGSGLGLAISKRLVTRMGGAIEVHSRKGRGSVFSVVFPLVAVGRAPVIAPPAEEIPEPVEPDTSQSQGGVPILVVEDNIETQRLIAAYLRDHYRLIYAQNADTALEAIEKEAPALILMDINLPGRDGLSIVKEIRSGTRCPDVPIIALTAFAMAGDRQKFLDAGCTDYLSKPATRREVLEAVNRLLQPQMQPA
jgi:PAS domain S-box-containing protein